MWGLLSYFEPFHLSRHSRTSAQSSLGMDFSLVQLLKGLFFSTVSEGQWVVQVWHLGGVNRATLSVFCLDVRVRVCGGDTGFFMAKYLRLSSQGTCVIQWLPQGRKRTLVGSHQG